MSIPSGAFGSDGVECLLQEMTLREIWNRISPRERVRREAAEQKKDGQGLESRSSKIDHRRSFNGRADNGWLEDAHMEFSQGTRFLLLSPRKHLIAQLRSIRLNTIFVGKPIILRSVRPRLQVATEVAFFT